LGHTGTATDLALNTTLDHVHAFLLLELTGTTTDHALDITLDRIWAFILLELSVTVTDLATDLAFNCTLLISCSLALALNAA
jgi:hypothetical protein